MKDILVEFTDHGAIIHKDPSIIASKKDLSNCVLNPDTSSVTGVSPSFWKLNESNRIVKCSQEEIDNRVEFHTKKEVENNTNIFSKTVVDEIREEFSLEIQANIEEIKENIESVKKIIKEYKDSSNKQMVDVNFSIEKVENNLLIEHEQIKKQLNKYKVGLIISILLGILGIIF